MARHQANRAATFYHTIVSLILLLGGGALLGLGIWLEVTSHGGPLDLKYGSGAFLNFVLQAGVLAIVVGAFMIITAVVALIALGRTCAGKTFRVLYIMFAMVILGVVILTAVVSWIIFARRKSPVVKDFFKDAWKRTLRKVGPKPICKIEQEFYCRSFDDVKCKNETCADCTAVIPTPSPVPAPIGNGTVVKPLRSCYTAITKDFRNVYLPTAIVATTIAAFVVVDVFVVCAL